MPGVRTRATRVIEVLVHIEERLSMGTAISNAPACIRHSDILTASVAAVPLGSKYQTEPFPSNCELPLGSPLAATCQAT